MCPLDLLQGKGKGRGVVGIPCTTLFGIAVRRCKCGKTGWRSKEEILLMDNTVQALIPFKERHRGLLKVHIQLGEGVSV